MDVDFKPIKVDLTDEITKTLESIGQYTADDIRRRSPRRKGTYAAGWTSKTSASGKFVTVYNSGRDASLSHLIEFGTARRRTKKGKNTGVMPPREHIRPAYEVGKKRWVQELKNIQIKPQ